MKTFGYKGIARLGVLYLQLSGLAAIVFCTSVTGGLVLLALLKNQSAISAAICFGLWFLLIGGLAGPAMINTYPTVWVEDQGLVISAFFFRRVAIPWSEIIDVGVGRVRFGDTLVRARHITPFHRVYGWLYSRSLAPSFLVGKNIEDRDELLREIRRRVRTTDG